MLACTVLINTCIAFAITVISVYADDPQYVAKINYLMNLSASQTFILNHFIVPDVLFNPAMAAWPLDVHSNPRIMNDSMSLIMIHTGGYTCRDCAVTYRLLDANFTTQKVINRTHDTLNFMTNRGDVVEFKSLQDPRLFRGVNGYMMVYSLQTSRNIQETFIAHIRHNSTDRIYIKAPIIQVNIDHEAGKVHQKNWMPFRVKLPGQSSFSILFVNTVFPHRIVRVNESMPSSEYKDIVSDPDYELMRAHTVCLTSINSPPTHELWGYGAIHGGTNAELVDTKYGPRYLSCFHSSNKWSLFYIRTYFMGCYVFQAAPPFAITHISTEPIIPKRFYDENVDGWAFKRIDYIVFPMNIEVVEENNEIVLAVGRNDHSGWIVRLKISGLIDSMKPVNSSTIINSFV